MPVENVLGLIEIKISKGTISETLAKLIVSVCVPSSLHVSCSSLLLC